jgi:hypothetical protein
MAQGGLELWLGRNQPLEGVWALTQKIQECEGRSGFGTVEIVEHELRIDSLRMRCKIREEMECRWGIDSAGNAFSCGITRAV